MNDPGGKILKVLEERGIGWNPVLRTNSKDLHPIFFGVYGGVIYHHGAGFRRPLTRSDIAHIPGATELAQAKQGTSEAKAYAELTKPALEENERLSELVFERIRSDDDFARSLSLA